MLSQWENALKPPPLLLERRRHLSSQTTQPSVIEHEFLCDAMLQNLECLLLLTCVEKMEFTFW
jgi:hypothetical protein